MIRFLKEYTLVIFVFIILGFFYGLYALLSITKEASPSVDIPYFTIITTYPGADPKTIDEQVTDKLEKKLKSISGIKKITSLSAYNVSSITLEFDTSIRDVNAANDIKSAIDQVVPDLPKDANSPISRKVDITGMPVYQFSVSGPYLSEELASQTKILKDQIEAIPGVTDVTIIGEPSSEIQLYFDLDKIQALGLDFATITNILRNEYVSLPADKKEIDGRLYSFEVSTYTNQLTGLLEQIRNTDIINTNGRTIKVSDIASVYLGSKGNSKKSYLRTGDQTINAITFSISRTPGFDVQSITLALKELVEEFRDNHPTLQTIEVQSAEGEINKTYDLFIENFWETGLFVFIVVVIFLGRHASLIVLIAFMLVYLLNFAFLKILGFSFNSIVSFSLILVLGIMVDNIIVMTQGVVIGLRETKGKMRPAIEHALKNYGIAVFFGTLCTMAIFFPLLFGLTGIIGQYMKSFPVVIDSNLAISLLVSLIGVPILFVILYKKKKKKAPIADEATMQISNPEKEFEVPAALHFLEKIGDWFADLFYRLNTKKKTAWWVIISFWAVFFASFFLFPLGFIKSDFLGNADQENIWINIKYSPGISIEDNKKNTSDVLHALTDHIDKTYPDAIEYTTIDIGTVNGEQIGGDTSNYSSITLKLVPTRPKGLFDILGITAFTERLTPQKEVHRTIKSYEMVRELQAYLDEIKGGFPAVQQISPVQVSGGPGGGKPIGFYIVGNDLTAVGSYVAEIMPEIKAIPGIFNISTNAEYTNGRFRYVLDANKLQEFNISSLAVITTLAGIRSTHYDPNGITIKEFGAFGEDTIPLKGYIDFSGNLQDVLIKNIPLSVLVQKASLEPELTSINRIDGEKAINIAGDKDASTALSDINTAIANIITNHPMPDGISYKAGGDAESQDTSGRDLGVSVFVGIILMYIVLMIMFKNIKYPTIIITSIFLTMAGVFIILAISGSTFNFPAQLGIFGVLGVGVNQGVIHVEDFKLFYEKHGMSAIDSFRKSISLRFIPIFLTKLTTILGLIILSMKDEIYGGMAMAFIGGLLVSFFVTLLYMPTLVRITSKDYYVSKEE